MEYYTIMDFLLSRYMYGLIFIEFDSTDRGEAQVNTFVLSNSVNIRPYLLSKCP